MCDNFCKYQDTTISRARQRPGRIVNQQRIYCCPECKKGIAPEPIDNYKIKYCPECGKRIIRNQPIILGKKEIQVDGGKI